MGGRGKIHLIGIGGISMSGIASILLDLGFEVSGSDLKDSQLLRLLERKGAKVFVGHRAENLEHPDEVVITSAIPASNVELQKAKEMGIPIIKRAQMIARLMEYKKGIAIAGTHGKTTTTSMVSLILDKAGFKPTILVGGEVNDIGGNAKLGGGEYLVTEADESDGSFLYYEPQISIVTNIEADHMDYYGTEDKLISHFKDFLAKVPEKGAKIVCWDDPIVRSIVNPNEANVITYGTHEDSMVHIANVEFTEVETHVLVKYKGEELGTVTLHVPGMHNVLNSMAALSVALFLEIPFTEIANSLNLFTGVHRRFERKGFINDVLVVDDYGHHPTEIKATLKAAKQKGRKRVITIFQPHRYTRTRDLKNEFSQSFADSDVIILTGVYSAGEAPIEGATGDMLAHLVEQHEKRPVTYFPCLDGIAEYLNQIVRAGDLVITLGAGDVYKVGEKLVKLLEESNRIEV